MRRLSQAGDTIIEVLICIGVVSLILGGAFVTTRNSQIGVRDSQEHAEALKLVESQIEQLRADAAGDGKIIAFGTPFCMYNQEPVDAATAPTSADCVQNNADQPTTNQPAYHLTVDRANSNGGYLFTVQAWWFSVTGNGKAQESMVYRLYQ
jgi:type II secretory pathway pseudopilin PulG